MTQRYARVHAVSATRKSRHGMSEQGTRRKSACNNCERQAQELAWRERTRKHNAREVGQLGAVSVIVSPTTGLNLSRGICRGTVNHGRSLKLRKSSVHTRSSQSCPTERACEYCERHAQDQAFNAENSTQKTMTRLSHSTHRTLEQTMPVIQQHSRYYTQHRQHQLAATRKMRRIDPDVQVRQRTDDSSPKRLKPTSDSTAGKCFFHHLSPI